MSLKSISTRLPTIFTITATVFLANALSSNYEPPAETQAEPQKLKYQSEAEKIAVVTTGELYTSDSLTQKVNHELELIRGTWGDSIDDVNIGFIPPWVHASMYIYVDNELYYQIKTRSNYEWNHLIQELCLDPLDKSSTSRHKMIQLVFTANLHPIRVAERFVGFPGVEYVHAGGTLPEWSSYFARVSSDEGAKYYFKRCTCPDLWNSYAYFIVDDDTAKYVETHFECSNSLLQSGSSSTSDYFETAKRYHEIIDSLEASRPAWVDTARAVIGEFLRHQSLNWSRDK